MRWVDRNQAAPRFPDPLGPRAAILPICALAPALGRVGVAAAPLWGNGIIRLSWNSSNLHNKMHNGGSFRGALGRGAVQLVAAQEEIGPPNGQGPLFASHSSLHLLRRERLSAVARQVQARATSQALALFADVLAPIVCGRGRYGLFDNRVLERIYEGEAGPFGLAPEVL